MAYNPNNPNGQATSANSAPVVIASDQSNIPQNLKQVNGSTISLGATTATNSLPVVLASNQSDIPVATSPAAILQPPTSNSLAALNATVQYQVESGAGIFMTLTNGPGATTAWSGTITFQYSLDGSSWNTFSVMPVASPANSAATSTATANGLFFASLPAGTANNQGTGVAYVRANMTAYTSGTVYFFVQSGAVPNARLVMPWVYSVTSGNTIMGPIEASGLSEIAVQISAVTTTVLTMQGTNDPTLATWQTIPVIQSQAAAASATTLTAVATYRVNPNGYKWVRLQVTTTGTVLTIQGITATMGQQIVLNSIGNDVGVTVNSGTLTTVSTVTTCSTVTSVTAVAALNSVATTNGLSLGTVVTAATPATQSIKATAGRLHHISVGNPNASPVYLKIFNVAAPTLGTTSANMNYLIPATSQTTIPINDVGLFFSTAIVVAVTGGIALADNTSISSGCAVSYSWI